MRATTRMSRGNKAATINKIWTIAQAHTGLRFSNQDVKDVTGRAFSNQFDVTKIDTSRKLPDVLKENHAFMVHLGDGNHRFIRDVVDPNGFRFGYFPVSIPRSTSHQDPWKYVPEWLDGIDDSEAGILSLAFNRRIIADFLFDNPDEPLRVHLPRRTRLRAESYHVGDKELVEVNNLQIEMDLLVEGLRSRQVGIIEAKVVKHPDDMPDFAVSQVFLPFRRLVSIARNRNDSPEVKTAFLLNIHRKPRKNRPLEDTIWLYEFEFERKDDMASIKVMRDREYRLERTHIVPGVQDQAEA